MDIQYRPRLIGAKPMTREHLTVLRDGLIARSCGCLRPLHTADADGLILSGGADGEAENILLVGGGWVGLRLCEDISLALRCDLPLCGIPLASALAGRRVWVLPCATGVGSLIRRISFRHAVFLTGDEPTVAWLCPPHTPPQSGLIARVLCAVSGYPPDARLLTGEAAAFVGRTGRPAFTVGGFGEDTREYRYSATREMLLLSLLL